VLNEKLFEFSAYIIRLRYEYIKKIEKISQKIQLDISGGKEELTLDYISCGEKIEQSSVYDIKDIMREKSKEIFKREMKYRECILGPHRDDIEFRINGSDLKLFGSQGQQKTAILVQKIAEVELFRNEIGEYPILLLDDIMSELDVSRQDFVLNHIRSGQKAASTPRPPTDVYGTGRAPCGSVGHAGSHAGESRPLSGAYGATATAAPENGSYNRLPLS